MVRSGRLCGRLYGVCCMPGIVIKKWCFKDSSVRAISNDYFSYFSNCFKYLIKIYIMSLRQISEIRLVI